MFLAEIATSVTLQFNPTKITCAFENLFNLAKQKKNISHSMYGIPTYINHSFEPNAGKYTIHSEHLGMIKWFVSLGCLDSDDVSAELPKSGVMSSLLVVLSGGL